MLKIISVCCLFAFSCIASDEDGGDVHKEGSPKGSPSASTVLAGDGLSGDSLLAQVPVVDVLSENGKGESFEPQRRAIAEGKDAAGDELREAHQPVAAPLAPRRLDDIDEFRRALTGARNCSVKLHYKRGFFQRGEEPGLVLVVELEAPPRYQVAFHIEKEGSQQKSSLTEWRAWTPGWTLISRTPFYMSVLRFYRGDLAELVKPWTVSSEYGSFALEKLSADLGERFRYIEDPKGYSTEYINDKLYFAQILRDFFKIRPPYPTGELRDHSASVNDTWDSWRGERYRGLMSYFLKDAVYSPGELSWTGGRL